MILDPAHLALAAQIADHYAALVQSGGDDAAILAGMRDQMVGFRYLVMTVGEEGMDALFDRHEDLYHFAQFLASVAEDLKSGKITVP